MLTEAERAEQAARTPDLLNFSKMTDKQKLSALATLHDATDYSGMTDGETAQAIARRHRGGNYASQADALQELKTCGLGDQDKIDDTLKQMRARLVQWAKGARGYAGEETDNATQEAAVLALATGGKVRSGGGTDWGALKRLLEERQDDWDQKLAGGYSRYVQSVIDSLVDEIVKGEKQAPAERAPEVPEESPVSAS